MMVHRREPLQRTPKEIEEVKGPGIEDVNILDAVRFRCGFLTKALSI